VALLANIFVIVGLFAIAVRFWQSVPESQAQLVSQN
jgi:hypothetical protein